MWQTAVSTKSQIKVALKHPQQNVSALIERKMGMWYCCHWGCEWGFDIKVTLKENGQLVGCSRHANWGRKVSGWWYEKRNDEMIGCYLPGERKGLECVCVKECTASRFSNTIAQYGKRLHAHTDTHDLYIPRYTNCSQKPHHNILILKKTLSILFSVKLINYGETLLWAWHTR